MFTSFNSNHINSLTSTPQTNASSPQADQTAGTMQGRHVKSIAKDVQIPHSIAQFLEKAQNAISIAFESIKSFFQQLFTDKANLDLRAISEADLKNATMEKPTRAFNQTVNSPQTDQLASVSEVRKSVAKILDDITHASKGDKIKIFQKIIDMIKQTPNEKAKIEIYNECKKFVSENKLFSNYFAENSPEISNKGMTLVNSMFEDKHLAMLYLVGKGKMAEDFIETSIPKEYFSDPEFVKVYSHGRVINESFLQKLDPSMLNDADFIESIIKNCSYIEESAVEKYLSKHMNDAYIAQDLLFKNPQCFKYFSADLRSYANIVRFAVQKDPSLFQYAADSIKGNKKFVLELLKKGLDPFFLIDQVEFKKADRLLVLENIAHIPPTLMSKELLSNDRDIIAAALKAYPSDAKSILEHCSDVEFIKEELQRNPTNLYRDLPSKMREDPEVARLAFLHPQDPDLYALEYLKDEKDFGNLLAKAFETDPKEAIEALGGRNWLKDNLEHPLIDKYSGNSYVFNQMNLLSYLKQPSHTFELENLCKNLSKYTSDELKTIDWVQIAQNKNFNSWIEKNRPFASYDLILKDDTPAYNPRRVRIKEVDFENTQKAAFENFLKMGGAQNLI